MIWRDCTEIIGECKKAEKSKNEDSNLDDSVSKIDGDTSLARSGSASNVNNGNSSGVDADNSFQNIDVVPPSLLEMMGIGTKERVFVQAQWKKKLDREGKIAYFEKLSGMKRSTYDRLHREFTKKGLIPKSVTP